MLPARSRRPAKVRKSFLLQKPRGTLTPRVQAVGPEHFGIVAIDCAKARSRCMFVDFFGNVICNPFTVAHTAGELTAAIQRIREAAREHDIQDLVVAIERTGEYHRPIQRAFRHARFDTRLVHPFTSKQYRQPADPGQKTDDNDLGGVFRATSQGFALSQPLWPELYAKMQLLARHRRDLVNKNTILRCQIREVLHAAMPGYAECFSDPWIYPAPLVLARQTTLAEAVRQAGVEGLHTMAQKAHIVCQRSTLHKILAWAEQAPPGHDRVDELRRILQVLDDDRLVKTQQILELEAALAHLAVHTPYVLLLRIPGVNIVTVADLASELGPIELYLNANAITGRAGFVPSRYQSDLVDYANGPLQRRGHRRLRAVLTQTASNLLVCNHHFQAHGRLWQDQGKDPRWIRIKIAKIFSRLLYAIVAGRQLFPHPCCQPRHYILGKLLAFHMEHHTAPEQTRQDLEAVIEQLPKSARADEAKPLQELLEEQAKRRRGPQPLATILPLVLARLGVRMVQSQSIEGAGP